MKQLRRLKEYTGFRLRLRMQRHADFALQIAKRYVGRTSDWQRPENMSLVYRPGWQSIVKRHSHHTSVRISPRINLNFALGLSEISTSSGLPEISTIVSPVRRVMSWLQNETLVQHIVSRRRRIETGAGYGPNNPEQEPILTVLRRANSTAIQEPDEPKLELAEAKPSPDRGYQRESAMTRAAIPAIDVNDLTNEVIRSIDRRIIARRERLGRI